VLGVLAVPTVPAVLAVFADVWLERPDSPTSRHH
jgi:hypothetical protein